MLSAVFGELADAIAIGAVIVMVAVLETVTERRAARAIDALKAARAVPARPRCAGVRDRGQRAGPGGGVLAGQPWRSMLLAGLTLAFATVPEELPILITMLLAVGGRQLARRGALPRRLRAGETLGAVTTVVTDKTGTLTENHLRLVEVVGELDEVLTVALHTQAPDVAGLAERPRADRLEPAHPTRPVLASHPAFPTWAATAIGTALLAALTH